jgi:hypothetical protein
MAVFQKTFSAMSVDVSAMMEDSANDTFSSTIVNDVINKENIKLLELMRQFGDFEVTSSNITVVANTQEYDLPADFGTARKVVRTDNNIELIHCPYDQYLIEWVETQTGYTYKYYIINAYNILGSGPTTTYAKIGFVPVPEKAMTVKVVYQPFPQILAAGTDISRVPGNFHDLIEIGACKRLAAMKGMVDLEKYFSKDYDERYRQFRMWLADDREDRKGKQFRDVWQSRV